MQRLYCHKRMYNETMINEDAKWKADEYLYGSKWITMFSLNNEDDIISENARPLANTEITRHSTCAGELLGGLKEIKKILNNIKLVLTLLLLTSIMGCIFIFYLLLYLLLSTRSLWLRCSISETVCRWSVCTMWSCWTQLCGRCWYVTICNRWISRFMNSCTGTATLNVCLCPSVCIHWLWWAVQNFVTQPSHLPMSSIATRPLRRGRCVWREILVLLFIPCCSVYYFQRKPLSLHYSSHFIHLLCCLTVAFAAALCGVTRPVKALLSQLVSHPPHHTLYMRGTCGKCS